MSITVTESLVFKFCTTDGSIVRVMQKRGSGIESFSAGQETINRFGIGLETWGDNNDRGDNKVDNNVWDDTVNRSRIGMGTRAEMSVINSTEFGGIMAEAGGSVLGLVGNGQP